MNEVLHNVDALYEELLIEHEAALIMIAALEEKVKDLQEDLNVPIELMQDIVIKGDNYIKTRLIEISSIQAINGGISIKLNDMTTSFVWSSLKIYQEQLPPLYFKRISKSCIINTENIDRRINTKVEMKNGDKFTISDTYKNQL